MKTETPKKPGKVTDLPLESKKTEAVKGGKKDTAKDAKDPAAK
jgi:hypothetical protein